MSPGLIAGRGRFSPCRSRKELASAADIHMKGALQFFFPADTEKLRGTSNGNGDNGEDTGGLLSPGV